VLPAASELTPALARRWLRAGLPRSVTSLVLPSLWLVAVVVAFASDTTRCTPQDPSVCGPDSSFAFAFVVLLATLVLLWWLPLLGCLSGVAFGLIDLRYDDVTGARWAFGLYGLLCALVAVRLVRGIAEQRRIADAAAGSGRAAAPAAPEIHGAARRRLVAGVLVLAGVGFFAWYAHEVSTERAHLRRAVQVPARIVEIHPDESVTVEVRTPSGSTREYPIDVYDYTDPYPLHSSTPVLLDPRDPDWIRLVAEPQDVTYWQSAGAGCLLLALLCLLQGWRWQRDLAALRSGEQAMLRVRIRPDDKSRALILPAVAGPDPHGDLPIGRLAVFEAADPGGAATEGDAVTGDSENRDAENRDPGSWDYRAQEDFGRAWRDEDPAGLERFAPPPGRIEDAVLIGDLRDGGVAMLVTDDAVLLPDGRLRIGRPGRRQQLPELADPRPALWLRGYWQQLVGAGSGPGRELFAGSAVDPDSLRQPIELPVTLRPRARTRAVGALLLLAGLAGFPMAVVAGRPDRYALLILMLYCGQLTAAGAGRLLGSLRLSHQRFEITGRWRRVSVPWDRLHGVRRVGGVLSVAWQPDLVSEVGPFDDPAGERGRQERAEQVGAMMLLQRRRALLGGLPGRETSTRPSLTWLLLAGYAVIVLVTVWRWR
jgi:hypothetical protein